MIELKGITWDHARGYDPMVATAAEFQKKQPDVRITWQKRSLKEFGDFPIVRLAETFDLLVIDHPFVGTAAATGCILPLDKYIDENFLAEQAENAVGCSHVSYRYDGHQWALAIDAAAQVSTYRADLMEKTGEEVPQTYIELVSLANRRHKAGKYLVAIPLCPIDSLMCFLSLCAIHDREEPFLSEYELVHRELGEFVLGSLKALLCSLDPRSLSLNPIQLYDLMSTSDDILYCPFAFGYSSYGRLGYSEHLLSFANVPTQYNNVPSAGAILGGTGYAISSKCQHIDVACEYGKFVADPQVQSGLYFKSGGRPGHRSAWLCDATNAESNQFFRDTLETLDNAYLRPRYHGFMDFQDSAWYLTHACLKGELEIHDCLDRLDELYRQSLQKKARQ